MLDCIIVAQQRTIRSRELLETNAMLGDQEVAINLYPNLSRQLEEKRRRLGSIV